MNCVKGSLLTITPLTAKYPNSTLTQPDNNNFTSYYQIISSCLIGGQGETSIFASTVRQEEVEELTREWQTLLLDMLQNDNNSITGMRPNIYSNNQCVVRDNNFLAFVRKWRGLAMRKSLNDGSPMPNYNRIDKINTWEQDTNSFGGKDPYMTDKDLEYVAALLQNTICVWNFSQGQWNMTTGVDRRDLSMASGIAIPPTADDNYPEPCLMLASTQNPAQTRGQDFNCDVDAQQMASVPATGHFDYIRINPNNVKAFNTHSGIEGVMNANAVLSNYNTQCMVYTRQQLCGTQQTNCKAFADKLASEEAKFFEIFFQGNFKEKLMYVDYFKILGFNSAPTKEEFYQKIMQLFNVSKNKNPLISEGEREYRLFIQSLSIKVRN